MNLKLKKLKRSIKASLDGKNWTVYFDGTEEEVNNTWNHMRCGYCNDDLILLKKQLSVATQ